MNPVPCPHRVRVSVDEPWHDAADAVQVEHTVELWRIFSPARIQLGVRAQVGD